MTPQDYTQLRDAMELEAAYLRHEYEVITSVRTSPERIEAFHERHRSYLERNVVLVEYLTAKIESDIHKIEGTLQ